MSGLDYVEAAMVACPRCRARIGSPCTEWACATDATWHTSRNTEGTAQSTRIVCVVCGDSDPATSLAAVISNRREVA